MPPNNRGGGRGAVVAMPDTCLHSIGPIEAESAAAYCSDVIILSLSRSEQILKVNIDGDLLR